jgi:hypothetical protein
MQTADLSAEFHVALIASQVNADRVRNEEEREAEIIRLDAENGRLRDNLAQINAFLKSLPRMSIR